MNMQRRLSNRAPHSLPISMFNITSMLVLGATLLLPTLSWGNLVPLAQKVTTSKEKTARLLITSHAEELGINGSQSAEIRLVRNFRVPNGEVFHYQQTHNGVPVISGDAAVLFQGNRALALIGKLHNLSSIAPLPNSRQGNIKEMEKTVRALWPSAKVRHASLGILPARNTSSKNALSLYVWILDVVTSDPFGISKVFVDAHEGIPLFSVPAMQKALGKGYQFNPVVSTLNDFTLNGLVEKGRLSGEFVNVERCKIKSGFSALDCDRLAIPDEDDNYFYEPEDPSLDDPFAEVQGYYHADSFHRYLAEHFGFARKSGLPIHLIVNLQMPDNSGNYRGYPNAFFGDIDGDKIGDLSFGQTDRDFVYDGDVVYHEFTHSVVDETSGLNVDIDSFGFNMLPLALNEGFADTFSSFFTNDPNLGEYISNGKSIRKLTGSASCPADLMGESHNDGQIWAQALWSIRSKLRETKVFDETVYTTMTSLSQTSDFKEAADLFRQIAQTNDPSLLGIADSEFKTRGIDNCSRMVPLDPGIPKQGYVFGRQQIYMLSEVPAGIQYVIHTPQEISTLTLELKGYSGYSSQAAVSAYLRRDQPVELVNVQTVTHDLKLTSDKSRIELSVKDSQTPLVPGATYYVLVMNEGKSTAMYAVKYTTTFNPPPKPDATPLPPDAGVPDAQVLEPDAMASGLGDTAMVDPLTTPGENGSSGCSCAIHDSAPEGSSWGLLGLFIAALFLCRRSRRNRRS